MENQHRLIKGYTELTQEQIDTMNNIKEFGNKLGELIDFYDNEKSLDIDKRWLAIAKTHFQEGLMALTRSITKPTFF